MSPKTLRLDLPKFKVLYKWNAGQHHSLVMTSFLIFSLTSFKVVRKPSLSFQWRINIQINQWSQFFIRLRWLISVGGQINCLNITAQEVHIGMNCSSWYLLMLLLTHYSWWNPWNGASIFCCCLLFFILALLENCEFQLTSLIKLSNSKINKLYLTHLYPLYCVYSSSLDLSSNRP